MRHPLPNVVLALVCCNCDYTDYTVQVGEHVVYHWDVDAWAAEGERLCGGTVKAADRFVAAIADHYEWPLPKEGPTIEYFWDRGIAKSACSWSVAAQACSVHLLSGFTVISQEPIYTHELAHTANGGHSGRPFISEGFATRWESRMVHQQSPSVTAENFFSEAELRAQLELDSSTHVDYQRAFTWWVALEASYGPAKMAEFISEFDGRTSADAVERALQRVFGISLAESAALAQALPPKYVEDPVCEFDGLPTLVWTQTNPLVIDRGEARCSDDDLITMLGGERATWLIAIEFPDDATTTVDVGVSVSAGEDPQQKTLVLAQCHGGLSDHEFASYDMHGATPPGGRSITRYMSGRYVAGLQGVITDDGAVEFPRAVFEESQP